MTSYWPLGRGDHARATVLSWVAGGVGAVALVIATMWARDENSLGRTKAASRFWTCIFGAAVALEYSTRRLFHPRLLACVLPTPAESDQLYDLLDPERPIAYRLAPIGFAVVAMAPLGPSLEGWHAVTGILFAWSLFRVAAPLLVWAAVAWRKVLVPRGPLVLWAAALLTAGGLIARFPAADGRGFEIPFILDPVPGWRWLVLAFLLTAIRPNVQRWCRARAKALFRREELMELAFAIRVQPQGKRRKLVLETLGGGPRRRRFLLLLQEGMGLRREQDGWRAGLLAAAVVGVMVLLGWTFGWTFGSGLHLTTTLLATAAVWIWGATRGVVKRDGRLTTPMSAYSLPVGQLELFGVQVVGFSAIYFGVGFVLALALIPIEFGEQFPHQRLGVAMANLVQVWFLGVATGALCSVTESIARLRAKLSMASRVRLVSVGFVLFVVATLPIVFAVISAFIMSGLAKSEPWCVHLPEVAKIILFLAEEPQAEATDLAKWQEVGRLIEVLPAWSYSLWAWLHSVGVFALSIALLVRRGRGQSAPQYGRCALAQRLVISAGKVGWR